MPTPTLCSVSILPVLFEAEWGLKLEADLHVTYLYEPASPGGRDRYGWDAPTEEVIEIEEAVLYYAGRVIDSNPSYDRAAVIAAIRAERKTGINEAELEALA